ncbi:MAG: spermidine/putrescine ABC transporter substrate-binding protein [Acidimicrobiales bacterium]
MKPRLNLRFVVAVLALTLFAVSCGDDGGTTTSEGSTPGATSGGGSRGEDGTCAVDEVDGDLNLYNWAEYIDPDLKTEFGEKYGISVNEDTFTSNEAMQPKISAGGSGYDVIVPSDYMVAILIESGDIAELQKDAIPNLANLAPDFAKDLPYDPAGDYSAPYQWGTTGFGVDLAVTGEDVPHTWGLVFDADLADQYHTAGMVTMLDDPRETLGAALKYLGYSLNSTDPDELKQAKDLLAEAKSRIAAFDSDQYDELLAQGQSVVAHGYSGNFLTQFGEADNPDQYTYFVPDEGGTRWVDNMAVVADAPHPCTAHAFINFILDAENGARLTNWNYYASPNEASLEFIDQEVLDDPIVYPEDVSKLEFIRNTGEYELNFSDAFIEAKG